MSISNKIFEEMHGLYLYWHKLITLSMIIVVISFIPNIAFGQASRKSLSEIRDSLFSDMQTVKHQVGLTSPIFAKTLNDLAKAEAD